MTRPTFTATILPGTPRAEEWRRVFGGDSVPLESAIPEIGHLPGVGFAPVLRVDVKTLTPEQIERAVVHLALRFGEDAETVHEGLFGRHGLPILFDDVAITVDASNAAREVTHGAGFPTTGHADRTASEP